MSQEKQEKNVTESSFRSKLDPATIRREEQERIATTARDTQRWVGGDRPAWAHEMFRQFAAAVENGELIQPEDEEEGDD